MVELLDCPKCNAELTKNQKFCVHCGFNLELFKKIDFTKAKSPEEVLKMKVKLPKIMTNMGNPMMSIAVGLFINLTLDWALGLISDEKFEDSFNFKEK